MDNLGEKMSQVFLECVFFIECIIINVKNENFLGTFMFSEEKKKSSHSAVRRDAALFRSWRTDQLLDE